MAHRQFDQCDVCSTPAYAYSIDLVAWVCFEHLNAFEDWCDEHLRTPFSAFLATAAA